MLEELPMDAGWANSLANTGKYLSQEEEPLAERGCKVLDLAADMFERAYKGMGDEPLSTRARVLVEDYARVAALQDEAGIRKAWYEHHGP